VCPQADMEKPGFKTGLPVGKHVRFSFLKKTVVNPLQIKKQFVSLQHPVPAKPLHNAQISGPFYFIIL
jgi:hypothetical protein